MARRITQMQVEDLTRIKIKDEVSILSFEFDDLVRYHGTKAICGLTVAFKVMEAAWEANVGAEFSKILQSIVIIELIKR